MPQLKNLIPSETLILPESGGEVVCAKSLTLSQALEISECTSDIARALKTIACLIRSWNFVDENGVLLPVDLDSVGMIPTGDAKVLMDFAAKIGGNKPVDTDGAAAQPDTLPESDSTPSND
jgi:hypothetical protein